jgi:hypothetical protein
LKQIEFSIPRNCDLSRAPRLIESTCNRRHLQLGMKGTLASFPGSIHWHYKRKSEKGTLELTLHAAERRLWAQIQQGRKAPWIDEELPILRREIERELKSLKLAKSAAKSAD